MRRVRKHRRILQLEITAEKIDRVELGNFSRQMAAFIKAGVPILDALEVIREEARDKRLVRLLSDVRDGLRFGQSFAEAMSEHGKALPPFYLAVLRSAEATGELDVVMGQLALYLDRDNENRRTVRAALVYPSLVMLLAAVNVVVMVAFVLPRFEVFFASFDATLPLPTRILLGSARFVTDHYVLLLVVPAVLGLLVAASLRTLRGRTARDHLILRLPGIGRIARQMAVERFCRVLASMIKAGVPMPEALDLAGSGAHNLAYRQAVERARRAMLEGGGLAQPIAQSGLFPPTVTQMMRVGEETGTLEEQLDNLAEFYGRDLQHRLKQLTGIVEPVVIVGVGLVVGFVAIAMVSAIYGVYDQVDI